MSRSAAIAAAMLVLLSPTAVPHAWSQGPVSTAVVNVLSAELRDAERSSDIDACRNWMISTADIKLFFAVAMPISGPEWHYRYLAFQCEVFGELEIDGRLFEYRLNAGAHAVLISGDTSFQYGCPEGCPVNFVSYRQNPDEQG